MRKGLGRLGLVGIVVVIAIAGAASIFLVFSQGPTQSASSSATVGNPETTSSSGPLTSSTVASTSASQPAESSSSSKAVSVVALKLVAGSATNASTRGTAYLSVALNNSGPPTTIVSINILRPPNVARPPIYQCSSTSSCSLISEPEVDGHAVTNFTTTATEFFVGVALLPNTLYGYEISFASGYPVLGTVNATAAA